MDYNYLEMSILFHHLLHQVYLQLNISDDTFLLMHKLMLSQILSSISISFDENIKKKDHRPLMRWLDLKISQLDHPVIRFCRGLQ